jgi:protein O-GlcNAc transferase
VRKPLDKAIALHQRGQLDEAARNYRKVLKTAPLNVEARHLFGVLRFQQGRAEEAIELIRSALKIKPNYPEALYNLGNFFSQLHRYDDAVAAYDQALALVPTMGAAHANRGNALLELRAYADALVSFDQALAIDPNAPGVLNNRGTALKFLRRFEEAFESYDGALGAKPDFTEALANKGHVFMELKRYEEAVDAYERALALKPTHKEALQGRAAAALYLCDWDRMGKIATGFEAKIKSITPFILLCYRDDARIQHLCAKAFSKKRPRVTPFANAARRRNPKDKITIAYLSADFCEHPVPRLLVELFERHDRSRFEVIAVSYGPDDGSAFRQRLVNAFDQFDDVQTMSDAGIAKLISERGVDIAIDLMGYTQNARPEILAYRPAPVQASYMGFPGTLGSSCIDYIVADPVVAPAEHQPFFSEQFALLPETYWVTDRTRAVGNTPTRQDAGLPEDAFVFCCFNSLHKIMPQIFDIWMRLLKAVPGSVLWLIEGPRAAQENLRREATVRGVDAGRLIFAQHTNQADHLARHRLADLFLDTLPYNAHTTASDALWMDLPLLTCEGGAFAGRVASSILQALGLPELVTRDLAGYEALAQRLATDATALAAIRAKLISNRSTQPLFDTDRFRAHVEAAYSKMWGTARQGCAPHPFKVDAFSG